MRSPGGGSSAARQLRHLAEVDEVVEQPHERRVVARTPGRRGRSSSGNGRSGSRVGGRPEQRRERSCAGGRSRAAARAASPCAASSSSTQSGRLVAGELDRRSSRRTGPGARSGFAGSGPNVLAGPCGSQLEQVLEPVGVRAREGRGCQVSPTRARTRRAEGRRELVQEGHAAQRRVGEGELDGVGVDLRAGCAAGAHRGPRIRRDVRLEWLID